MCRHAAAWHGPTQQGSAGETSNFSWLLRTKTLMMTTFVDILLDKGLITSQAFTALWFMAVPSTMLAMPVVYPSLRDAKSLIFRKS
jgi:hypothetical protein